jgi:tRNA(Arg) A34 adenosine deaminase TadA
MASAALLVGPWRECFELAWEAFRAGTIPVGAVVADESGAIVARGRNHIFDEEAPAGQLANTFIAHAELNALAGLPPRPSQDGRAAYGRHALYTTLEPCALCVGAAVMVMVGEVRYASSDHYGGGTAFRLENPHTTRQPLVMHGPLEGLLGELGELFHVAHFLWRKPDSYVIAAHRERNTGLVELAARLDLMAAATAGASLDDAIELVGAAR